jgi:hypothetical protein
MFVTYIPIPKLTKKYNPKKPFDLLVHELDKHAEGYFDLYHIWWDEDLTDNGDCIELMSSDVFYQFIKNTEGILMTENIPDKLYDILMRVVKNVFKADYNKYIIGKKLEKLLIIKH